MTAIWGLRPRLVAWVAAVLLVVLAATFAVVYERTGSELRSQIAADAHDDLAQLMQATRALPAGTPAELSRRLSEYVRGRPYQPNATLLFAAVAGRRAVTNHPELLGLSRPDRDERPGRQAAENAQGAALLAAGPGVRDVRAPDAGPVRLVVRDVSVAGVRVRLGAGEPLAAVSRAQRGVARSFVIAGVLALVFALVAAWFAGSAVTRPLRRLSRLAGQVDEGELDVRMHVAPGAARELRVLADALNHMLDRLAAAFDQQQRFIADASHELRTPLTVIRGQVEMLAGQQRPSPADVRRVGEIVAAEIGRTARLVDDLLLLARAEQADFVRPQRVALRTFVTEMWSATTHGRGRRFELGEVAESVAWVDPDRLAQALRNLIENAIAHTEPVRGTVRLDVAADGDIVRFTVSDDGPGIPEAERERVFERLRRVDEARARVNGGAGLGLSIVRVIAEAHGGSATVADSPRGARVELEIAARHRTS